mmetsp:Transcript_34520/g.81845  ORF Transcript_34520/g.81845 Transcript_34520/m.81845 type:complete len:231 (+) Transcript_34520:399-1091(+)
MPKVHNRRLPPRGGRPADHLQCVLQQHLGLLVLAIAVVHHGELVAHERVLRADRHCLNKHLLGEAEVTHPEVLHPDAEDGLVQPWEQPRRRPVCGHGLVPFVKSGEGVAKGNPSARKPRVDGGALAEVPLGRVMLPRTRVVAPNCKPRDRLVRILVDKPVRSDEELVLLPKQNRAREMHRQTVQVVGVPLQDARSDGIALLVLPPVVVPLRSACPHIAVCGQSAGSLRCV